jgi:hypothetical protein
MHRLVIRLSFSLLASLNLCKLGLGLGLAAENSFQNAIARFKEIAGGSFLDRFGAAVRPHTSRDTKSALSDTRKKEKHMEAAGRVGNSI